MKWHLCATVVAAAFASPVSAQPSITTKPGPGRPAQPPLIGPTLPPLTGPAQLPVYGTGQPLPPPGTGPDRSLPPIPLGRPMFQGPPGIFLYDSGLYLLGGFDGLSRSYGAFTMGGVPAPAPAADAYGPVVTPPLYPTKGCGGLLFSKCRR